MGVITFEAEHSRLRIEGSCLDIEPVREAIGTLPPQGELLTIDLTAATEISAEVATLLVRVAADVPEGGHARSLLRHAGSKVDEALRDAGDRRTT
jgi:hypothetical protein